MSELLTVAQVAALLQVSTDTVMRRFSGVKGVIDIGSKETPKRRQYRVLRIPRTIVEKWAIQHGGQISLAPAPAKPKSGKRPDPQLKQTEDSILRELALAASQHGDAARKTLNKIHARAKTLTFLPPDQWAEVVWLDEEDERD